MVLAVNKWKGLSLDPLLNLRIYLIVFRGGMPKLRLLVIRCHPQFLHDELLRFVPLRRAGNHKSQCVHAHLLKLLLVFDFYQEAHLFNQLAIGAYLTEG